jgi:hypothetical protein
MGLLQCKKGIKVKITKRIEEKKKAENWPKAIAGGKTRRCRRWAELRRD